jgi:hypothetical protein
MLDYFLGRSALAQGNVYQVWMIVGNVCAPKSPKMIFVERNTMVEQLSTRAADPTFPLFHSAKGARYWCEEM